MLPRLPEDMLTCSPFIKSARRPVGKRLATTLAQFVVDGHLDKARDSSSAAWLLASARIVSWMREAEEKTDEGGGAQLLEARALLQKLVRRLPAETVARLVTDGLEITEWQKGAQREEGALLSRICAEWVAEACENTAAFDAEFASRVSAVQETLTQQRKK